MLPAELQGMLSQNLGVPASSVTVYARQMREAGHLNKHGRGIYAARMTPRDCAMLMVAVAGATGPAEAAAQVSAFLETRPTSAAVPGVLADLGMDADELCVVDVVERLIEAVRSGEAEKVLSNARISLEQAREALTLSFRITNPVGLTLQFRGYNSVEGREFAVPMPAPALPGMRTFRLISGDALISLGLALRDEP